MNRINIQILTQLIVYIRKHREGWNFIGTTDSILMTKSNSLGQYVKKTARGKQVERLHVALLQQGPASGWGFPHKALWSRQNSQSATCYSVESTVWRGLVSGLQPKNLGKLRDNYNRESRRTAFKAKDLKCEKLDLVYHSWYLAWPQTYYPSVPASWVLGVPVYTTWTRADM